MSTHPKTKERLSTNTTYELGDEPWVVSHSAGHNYHGDGPFVSLNFYTELKDRECRMVSLHFYQHHLKMMEEMVEKLKLSLVEHGLTTKPEIVTKDEVPF